MVLEMKPPHDATLAALRPVLPVLLSYLLSFVYIGIYWNNHHHLLHATRHVNGATLWANLHLLFWLSLVPFATAWMDTNQFAAAMEPVAVYGIVLSERLRTAYFILTMNPHPPSRTQLDTGDYDRPLADRKGLVSIVIYAVAIPLAFIHTWIAGAGYVMVAIIWIVPDVLASNEKLPRRLKRYG